MNVLEQTYFNLDKLDHINKILETQCFYLVFGGFAMDGLRGSIARPHKDIDMLCFRRDAGLIKKALAKIGIKLNDVLHIEDSSLIYKMVSQDLHKTVTIHILDEVLDNCFEISFYRSLRIRFPVYLIAPKSVTLERVLFPVPQIEFLIQLKKMEHNRFEKVRMEKPQVYFEKESIHIQVKKDLELMESL